MVFTLFWRLSSLQPCSGQRSLYTVVAEASHFFDFIVAKWYLLATIVANRGCFFYFMNTSYSTTIMVVNWKLLPTPSGERVVVKPPIFQLEVILLAKSFNCHHFKFNWFERLIDLNLYIVRYIDQHIQKYCICLHQKKKLEQTGLLLFHMHT